jgi:CSLREA domain-containing protein
VRLRAAGEVRRVPDTAPRSAGRHAILLALVALLAGSAPARGAVFTVDSTADFHESNPGDGVCSDATNGLCTLRAAIEEANAVGGSNTVDVPAGTYSLTLGALVISSNLTLQGLGAAPANTVISGSATSPDRVLYHFLGTASISNVTITGGACLSANECSGGGGIYNSAPLTITASVVRDNTSEGTGGGIYNAGMLTILDSTISGNSGGQGGGLENFAIRPGTAPAILVDSTFSGNQAASGAAIENRFGDVVAANVTVFDNSVGPALEDLSNNGGVFQGSLQLENTIAAGNTPSDCDGDRDTTTAIIGLTADYTLLGPTCNVSSGTGNVAAGPLLAIGPLADNGGPTQTHALLIGSPAIDAGDPTGCKDASGSPLTADQRGLPRPGAPGTRCDIGAFELQSVCGNGVVEPGEACDSASPCCAACQFASPQTVCRAATDVCDAAELCTGESESCPADAVQPASTQCRGAAGVCDVAEFCDGASKSCPADAFQPPAVQCRAASGVCDAAEFCTGVGPSCPADAVQPASTQCRAAAGACDAAEFCNGASKICPPDAFQPSSTQCRAAAGVCDVAEFCTGTGPACPVDGFRPGGTLCRSAVDPACDIAEYCSGAGPACPTDGGMPNGTPCPDGTVCNGQETCQAFRCTAGVPLVCDDGLFCDGMETCDASAGCQPGTDLGPACIEDPSMNEAVTPPPSAGGWGEAVKLASIGDRRFAFVAAGGDGLLIYDVTDPTSPVQPPVQFVPGGACAETYFDELAIDGTSVYVAGGSCGLLTIDVSDPDRPQLVSIFDTPIWAKDVVIHDYPSGERIAFVADHSGGLRVVQVNGPGAPIERSALPSRPLPAPGNPRPSLLAGLLGPAMSVQVAEQAGSVVLYLATTEGFYVIDASFFAMPVIVGALDLNPMNVALDAPSRTVVPQHHAVANGRAYVALWKAGLDELDVSDPFAPSEIDRQPTYQAYFEVATAARVLFAAEGECGLRAFKITSLGLLPAIFPPTPGSPYYPDARPNPIPLADSVFECAPGDPELFDPTSAKFFANPWAWGIGIDPSSGLVYVSSGILVPGANPGQIQSNGVQLESLEFPDLVPEPGAAWLHAIALASLAALLTGRRRADRWS